MADWKPKYNQGVNWSDMGPGHSRVAMGIKTRPGGGCDLYEGKKRDKTSIRPGIMVTKGVAKRLREINRADTGKPIDQEAAMDLYNKGAGDSQIATALGVTKQTVLDWRQAHGLESNHLKFRKENPT